MLTHTNKLLRFRRTKIVATLGPASTRAGVLEELIGAGANVFRLNMSHGNHDTHRAAYEALRTAARKLDATIAVLADLCGPKIRVGTFQGGSTTLTKGDRITVTTRDVVGGPKLVASQYAKLANDVVPGSRILLDDGNLELRVESIAGTEITCAVVTGGLLKDKKGMNLPGVQVSVSALTEKDKDDARFAIELGVDFLALSFVRTRADVDALRVLIDGVKKDVPIISKIEKPEALDNIDEILDASDALMIARGDLGVELPPEEVPNVQEELVDLARVRNRPVIVATQMLESMMTHARPTRAEVTDVANAVRSGADAVMLSGETAAGAYPIEAVRTMDTIVRQTEAYLFSHGAFGNFDLYTPTLSKPIPPIPMESAVANAVSLLSRELLVRGIVIMTRSGRSLEVLSSARPSAPLVGVSSSHDIASFGCLTWGVIPLVVPDWETQDPRTFAKAVARKLGLLDEGRGSILLVRGFSTELEKMVPSVSVVPVP